MLPIVFFLKKKRKNMGNPINENIDMQKSLKYQEWVSLKILLQPQTTLCLMLAPCYPIVPVRWE
jgi:hypothetical protein